MAMLMKIAKYAFRPKDFWQNMEYIHPSVQRKEMHHVVITVYKLNVLRDYDILCDIPNFVPSFYGILRSTLLDS